MKLVDKIKEGDILYTNCIGNELCYHLGIVYSKGGKKYIFHNAPTQINRFGGTVVYEKFEDFKKGRDIKRIVRTNVTNQRILQVVNKHKSEVWDSLFFNCEDFVLEIVQGKRQSDLRDAWKVAALGLAIFIIY
jgi:hypothetical protein